MALATLAFFACAFPFDFAWFFAWRFASGLAGGVLMCLRRRPVLPGVSRLAARPGRRRHLHGVGAGIAASGTLVPLLLRVGVSAAWVGLGALSFLLTVIGWSGWPRAAPATAPARNRAGPRVPALRSLYVMYALNGIGWMPHMIFLVDFVARAWARAWRWAQSSGWCSGSLRLRAAGCGTLCRPHRLRAGAAPRLPPGGARDRDPSLRSGVGLADPFEVSDGPSLTGTQPQVLGR